jgi:hypothetical protein
VFMTLGTSILSIADKGFVSCRFKEAINEFKCTAMYRMMAWNMLLLLRYAFLSASILFNHESINTAGCHYDCTGDLVQYRWLQVSSEVVVNPALT